MADKNIAPGDLCIHKHTGLPVLILKEYERSMSLYFSINLEKIAPKYYWVLFPNSYIDTYNEKALDTLDNQH